MANLSQLVEDLSSLTVLEAAELTKLLEEKWGVTAAAPVAVAAVAASGDAGSAAAEKTEFSVILTNPGEKRTEAIKVVRQFTGLGLKESKDLVDAAPKAVKEGVSKDEAEKIKKAFAEIGATCDIK